MENKPQIIFIADDDKYYGIKHGFYRNMLEAGSFKSMSVKDFKKEENSMIFKTPPQLDGNDFYFLDRYSQRYFSMRESDFLKELSNSRSIVIKEACVRMGAKSVSLHEKTAKCEDSHTKGEAKGNYGVIDGNIDIDNKKNLSLNTESTIKSNHYDRKPYSYEDVEKYVHSHGLYDDDIIMNLLDRFKREGRLHGTETYSISYSSELQSTLTIACKISAEVFGVQFDYTKELKSFFSIEKTLDLDFGE